MLISGSGTNLQALIDAPDIEVACVVSSRADAGGLARAEAAGLPALASADESETLEFLERHTVGSLFVECPQAATEVLRLVQMRHDHADLNGRYLRPPFFTPPPFARLLRA